MTRTLKVLSFVIGLTLIVAVVVLLPYKARGVPEWRIQVVDENERPVSQMPTVGLCFPFDELTID